MSGGGWGLGLIIAEDVCFNVCFNAEQVDVIDVVGVKPSY